MTGRFVREAKRPTWKPSGQDQSASAPFTAAATLCGLRNARWIGAHRGDANARVQEVRVPLERDERVGVPGDRLDELHVSAGSLPVRDPTNESFAGVPKGLGSSSPPEGYVCSTLTLLL
jgi:hypothetical protein